LTIEKGKGEILFNQKGEKQNYIRVWKKHTKRSQEKAYNIQ